VVADRYPQIEVPGFYDGPGLSAAHTSNPLILWLAARERALYQLMAAQLPTLVLRLNISMETALARKPDHEPDLLARKIAVTPRLTFNGAHIVEIDANRPYDDVLAAVTQAIDKALGDS
jgi:thymidylate kinase